MPTNLVDHVPASTANESRHDEIARRAYELWEQNGCPHGEAEKHWLEAERQILGLAASTGEPLRNTEPAQHGNPAYPSLAARDVMVEQNAKNPVRIHPIPGNLAKR